MIFLKFTFIILFAIIITPLDATCRKKQKSPCANRQTPLQGYFCGRGPTRQDCPPTHECIIAPNDAYAVCCPRTQQTTTTPAKPVEKPGSCPTPSAGFGICIARCTYDSDCEGNLKCCGNCPRVCVKPSL